MHTPLLAVRLATLMLVFIINTTREHPSLALAAYLRNLFHNPVRNPVSFRYIRLAAPLLDSCASQGWSSVFNS
ncbi:hypothetical protein F5Y01DRAFT_275240 [Xylaria sp. FL0043]|nr:hypothetical protein F5Y01DRAFT_275240 [Xylaria sp. FL0043]